MVELLGRWMKAEGKEHKSMKDNDMESLLQRWAKLEPDWCNHLEDRGIAVTLRPVSYDRRVTWGDGYLVMPTDESLLYIQGSVQAAIEARGWDWLVESMAVNNDQHPCLYSSAVSHGEQSVITTGFIHYGAAAALLSAYLEAVEKAPQEAI